MNPHASSGRWPHATRRYRHARAGAAYRHGFRMTVGGGAYIALCLFLGLAAANSQHNLLFLVFGILLGGLVVSGVLSTLTMARLRATRRMPLSAFAGQTVQIVYALANRKRMLASYSMHVCEYRSPLPCGESYLPAVPARGQRTQRATLLCQKRGIHPLGAVTIYTRFPFSLFVHYSRFKAPDELVVFPAIGRLTHRAANLLFARGATIHRPMDRRGGDEEFFSLRDYRQGDNPKRIYWRRSARLGNLLVREMSPPMPRRLIVLVTAAPAADVAEGATDDRLEKALSLAATLLCDATAQAFEVGLLVTTGSRPKWFAPSRGPHQRFAMLRSLAALRPGVSASLQTLPARWLRNMAGAQCVWITRGLDVPAVARQVNALAAMNIAVQPIRAETGELDRLLRLPSPAPDERGPAGREANRPPLRALPLTIEHAGRPTGVDSPAGPDRVRP